MKRKGLLDIAAAYLGCQYISDLRYLTPYQRCVLATHLEGIDSGWFSLFEWNDALNYLCRKEPAETAAEAKTVLLKALRSL